MAVAPSVQNSTQTDYSGDAVKSPTTLVMEYLAKNKMSPNMHGYSAAVRKALEDNAADPTLIPGLRADRASTEAEDQAAMRAAGKGGPSVGQRGNAATQIEGGSEPTQRGNPPMVDLGEGPTNEANNQPQTTSAQPRSSSGMRTGPDDFASFLTPAAIAAAAVGAGAIPGMMGNRPEFVGNAQPPSGRVTDVNPTAIAGPSPDVALPPPTTMEAAMQEAIRMPGSSGLAGAPAATAASQGGNLWTTDPAMSNNPMDLVAQGRQLPAGINPYEVGGSANPAPRTTILPENTRGAPVVPLSSATPRNVPMRQMTTPSYYKNIPAQTEELFNLGRRIIR